jgi:hypothetical protein
MVSATFPSQARIVYAVERDSDPQPTAARVALAGDRSPTCLLGSRPHGQFDGLHLTGALVSLGEPPDEDVVFVHGGGVTHNEGGFFTWLAS